MSDDRIKGWLKEILAALIGVALLCVSVYMLLRAFVEGGGRLDVEGVSAFNREKDILTITISLFGTVTGYYLGRVPAELRAQKAEENATSAQNKLGDAQNQVSEARVDAVKATAAEGAAKTAKERMMADVQRAMTDMQRVAVGRRATLSAGSAPPAEVAAIESALSVLSETVERNKA
jgi:hypothetical protein